MTGVLKARVGGAWVDVASASAEEVHVGPSAPVGNEELWYDTDEAGAQSGAIANPNNALGVIAKGGFLAALADPMPVTPVGTQVRLTDDLAVTLLVGRRYRVTAFLRATTPSAANSLSVHIFDSNTNMMNTWGHPAWSLATASYGQSIGQWLIDGDGVARLLNIRGEILGGGTVSIYKNGSLFYVEDMGPNGSPALPIPTTYQTWTPFTFQNNWVNYGGNYPPGGYRKIGDIVYLRGLIRNGTLGGTIPFATLPVGFRPAYYLHMPVACNDAFGIVRASNTTGELTAVGSSNAWVSLDPLQFSVTP